jgi:hypothetical protein
MKKLISILGTLAVLGTAGAQNFKSYEFLNDSVYLIGTNGSFAGFTVTNAASAPLGGYTNINSWNSDSLIHGTNMLLVTWTNINGIWVIPTNNTPLTSVAGVQFVTNDVTQLTKDIPLWLDKEARLPLQVFTNTFAGDANTYPISPMTLSCRIFGAASFSSGSLNLNFVGLPDGTNEITTMTPTFQWGISAAAGTTVTYTNFPIWKFAGCGKIRLRSAVITTTSAANIGCTIQDLRLNGFVP